MACRGFVSSRPANERFLERALARTTEVLAPSMPSGSNAGNGHVRTKRPSPVLGGNSLTRPKIADSCVTVGIEWTYGVDWKNGPFEVDGTGYTVIRPSELRRR